MYKYSIIIALVISNLVCSQTVIQDRQSKIGVSFATISFGNGNGLFADEDGQFIFTQKLYNDIDSLYISAVGYKAVTFATKNLASTLFLEPSTEALDEVIITTKPKGKFKTVTIKPNAYNDYFKCWLPTIESEIAVFFPNNDTKTKQVSKVLVPIKVEDNWDNKSSNKLKFSTLFRLQFYENNNGVPGDHLTSDNVLFIATENSKNKLEIDVSKHNIYVPKSGIYVSIQVLGYTNAKGKLLPNKKYQEVKTKRGIVKVSTTFRPLLPFTDKVIGKNTYVKRVFLNGNRWQRFDQNNINDSNLLSQGLTNYGMGLKLQVYKK